DTQEQRRRCSGLCIPEFSKLLIVPAENGVLFPDFPQADDLPGLQLGGFARIGYDLFVKDPIVLFQELKLINRIFFQETRVARIDDRQFPHHLPHDHFDMFVVDLHPLQPVNLLDLVHHVFLDRERPLDGQDIRRRHLPVGQLRTCLDKVPVLRQDLPGQGDQVFLDDAVLGFDDDFAVPAFDIAERNHTVDFADDRGVTRVPGLKEFRNARQTAGDITQLAEHARDLHDDLAGPDVFPFFDHDMGADRQVVGLGFLAALDIDAGDLGLVLGFDDDLFAVARLLVGFFPVGDAFQDRVELDRARDFGDDDIVKGIPVADDLALRYLLAVLDDQSGAVRHVIGDQQPVVLHIHDPDLTGTADDDLLLFAFIVLGCYRAETVELDRAF